LRDIGTPAIENEVAGFYFWNLKEPPKPQLFLTNTMDSKDNSTPSERLAVGCFVVKSFADFSMLRLSEAFQYRTSGICKIVYKKS
jgi:hypothetical protein